MEPADLGREKDDGLSRRVPAADQRHFLALAQLGLDRRGPIGDAGALEDGEARDLGASVSRPGGHDDAAYLDDATIDQLEAVRAAGIIAAMEAADLERDRQLGA